jgi:hypothetical protein
MYAVCAVRTARVDVKQSLQIATVAVAPGEPPFESCDAPTLRMLWTRMWVAACRQPASADPKRAGGNADLAVRHPGAFHRHSALSKTGGTDDTAVTTQLQQLLDASRQGARADRGAFLWNSTNSKPHQRRASSCRQKPSRSLRRCNRGAPSRRGHLRYRKRSRNPRHK